MAGLAVFQVNCKKRGTITIAHTRFDLYELSDRNNNIAGPMGDHVGVLIANRSLKRKQGSSGLGNNSREVMV